MIDAKQAPGASPPGRPGVFDVQGFVRKYIPFSSLFRANQKTGMGQDVIAVFTAANADLNVPLALGQVPTRYIVNWKSAAGDVYNGSRQAADWKPNLIVLRCSAPITAHVTVF